MRVAILLVLLVAGCSDAGPLHDCRNSCFAKTGSSDACGCD